MLLWGNAIGGMPLAGGEGGVGSEGGVGRGILGFHPQINHCESGRGFFSGSVTFGVLLLDDCC